MNEVLYADVLFMIDFSMDTVALWLTGRFLHASMSAKRVAIAAGISALLSTVLTVLSPGVWIVNMCGIITAVLMCLITYGRANIFTLLKQTGTLWVVGLLLGGIMTYLTAGELSYGRYDTNEVRGDGAVKLLPIAVFLCAVLLFVVSRVSMKKNVSVSVELFETRLQMLGLADTGNLLCDPMTGDPVIIISRSQSEELIGKETVDILLSSDPSMLDDRLKARYRTIFVRGASGEVMMPCLRPDSIQVGRKKCKAIIGLSYNDSFSKDIYCIVPASLL